MKCRYFESSNCYKSHCEMLRDNTDVKSTDKCLTCKFNTGCEDCFHFVNSEQGKTCKPI